MGDYGLGINKEMNAGNGWDAGNLEPIPKLSSVVFVPIDNRGNAPLQLRNCGIGSDGKHYFRPPVSHKPEFTFSTEEAVALPAPAYTEFVFNGAILPMPFGGEAEFFE